MANSYQPIRGQSREASANERACHVAITGVWRPGENQSDGEITGREKHKCVPTPPPWSAPDI